LTALITKERIYRMAPVFDILDVIVEPRYDTATIPAAGSALLTYFANPIGQGQTNFGAAGITKNLADTNMDLSGQLPAGYNFVLLGFRLAPTWNITQPDTQLAFNGCVFTFTIGSKPYLRVPATTIPAGNGPYSGSSTIAAGANTQVSGNGIPVLVNSYSIARKPLELLQTQNFQAALTWPSGVQAVTTTLPGQPVAGLPVRIYLDGYLKRRVQ
jgi:hypothetical protein